MLNRFLYALSILLVGTCLAFGQSALTITETPPFTGAAIGAGYDFGGGMMLVPTSASLRTMALPFSISFDAITPNTPAVNSAWINTAQFGTNTGVEVAYLNSQAAENFHVQTLVRPSGTTDHCDATNIGGMCWRSNYTIGNSTRHHYCDVWTASHAYFYIDGVLRDETNNVGSFSPSLTTWEMGTSFFAGNKIFDMRIYNRALSADECVYINELQQANLVPNSGSTTLGMIAHWAFSDCTTTGALVNCPDTVNGNTATNDAAPPVVTMTAPTTGMKIGNVTVQSTCVDPAGLACEMVCYLLDGTALSLTCPTTSPYTYTWNSATAVDGTRVISAIGFNGTGVPGASVNSVSVTASNGTTVTNYYFNASTGSDSNDCLAAVAGGGHGPCLTEAKLQSIVIKGGDTVHLVGSFSWTAAYNLCAGDSGCATQNFYPSALTTTFTGPGGCNPFSLTTTNCAVINVASGVSNAINATNPGNVTWENTAVFGGGVALSSYCLIAGNSPSGTGLHFHSPLIGPNITVQNNWVQDFSCGIGINDTGGTGAMLNFVIQDNVVNGSTNTAAMTQGIRWGPGSQGTVEGNLVFNTGGQPSSNGNGIIGFNYPAPTGGPGSLVKFNVVHDFGANNTSCGGPIGIYATFANNIDVRFNEVYRGLPATYPTSFVGCDWAPFDIDQGGQFITVEYNYGHDNPIASFEMFVLEGNTGDTFNNNIMRYNIAENNNGAFTIAGSGYDNTSYIYNNTSATNLPVVAVGLTNNGNVCWGGGSVGVTYANNLCIYTGTATTGISYINTITSSPATVFLNNGYWSTQPGVVPFYRYGPLFAGVNYATLAAYQTASGLDANSLNVNPMLAGTAGTGGTCWNSGTSPPAGPRPCPSTSIYGLVHGSPMIGAGTDVAALSGSPPADPTVDYWGNPVPNAGPGSGWNIGAFGAAP